MTTALPSRGAEVTITSDGVKVTRSSVSASLFPDANISPSELLGWYRQAPDGLSPGWIELLTRDSRPRINFSPTQTEQFAAINAQLINLQAGYPLEPVDQAVSAEEWMGTGETGAAASEKKEEKAKEPAKRQRAPWAKVATPDEVPEANLDADIDNPIFGQNVTVTGDVEPYDKGEVWDMIAQAGGTVGKNVTKKTTMLVVGEWASVTSKEKRARELKDKGQEIAIVSFDEFLRMVGK